ncbi:CHAT domain-containing protein [Streptomyces sp. NPDC050485]|uniref:CHAT domain-containing tetratricopeptide repeat protein n=1 Tax=Streptomyces sp. NPDC050485 TaxID=3365617 RepID=UPI0037A239C9
MLTHRGRGCEAVHPICPECGAPALNVVVPTILERMRHEDVRTLALRCQACNRAEFRYNRDMFCDRCEWLIPRANERFAAEPAGPPGHAPPTPAGSIGAWGSQALSKLRSAAESGDRDALDTAIELFDRIVRALPVGDAMRLSAMSNLGIGLRMRAEQRRDGEDADAAVRALREVLDAGPPDSPHRPRHSTNLGNALYTRAFLDTSRDGDLDEAAEAHRAAVAATPRGDRSRTGRLVNLARTLRGQYDRTRRRADLDTAIEAWREILDTMQRVDPQAPCYASEFALAVRTRLEDFAYDTDVDAGFSAVETVIAGMCPGPERRDLLLSLGSAMLTRYQHNGDRAAAETAVKALRQAADEAPPGSRERATHLNELGLVLGERLRIESSEAAVDAAVVALQEAVPLVPPDDPQRPKFLSNLAITLRSRFEHRGDPADLDAAIRVLREAESLMSEHDPDRPRVAMNLGNALLTRFEQHWDRADIDHAISMLRLAAGSPGGSLEGALSGIGNLALGLARRYEQFRDGADLDEAIAVGRRAVEQAPAAYPGRIGYLSNLGHGLMLRFERDKYRGDLDSAIDALRITTEATDDDHLHHARNLSNLGVALLARFDLDAARADLDRAVGLLARAAGTTRVGDRERAAYLFNLGSTLTARHDRFKRPEDADAAIKAWQTCCALPAIPASTRMMAGQAWGMLAARLSRWPEAVHGYGVAVESLPLLAWRGVGRDSQERLLTQWRGLASDAAACAIAAGRPEHAVELLDRGRGVLWSQLLDLRTEIDALMGADPRLAAELGAVRAELDGGAAAPPTATTSSPPVIGEGSRGADADRRINLARRWDTLIDQVRALPGFHDFARSPSFDRLRGAAGEGTVAVVNVSQWRCDALLITEDGVQVRRLDGVDRAEAWRRADAYMSELQKSQHAQAEPDTARQDLERVVTETLTWLWDAIAEPVLDALGHTAHAEGQPWPRLWWCPTGPLTVLPLHAAGHHRRTGQSVLDRVVSSYTPTLRALDTSRRRPVPTSPEPESCLLIALQNTPGQAALPAVAAEQAYLTQLLGRERLTALVDADATKANILESMEGHAWVHASCHGDQNLADPSAGGLVPHDWERAGLVRVLDLNTAGPASGGEFAFLSACKTATGGLFNLDEGINLVSALQYGGWRHVIGTLWSVGDISAAEIMFATYQRLLGDSSGHGAARSAVALHEAVRAYRDRADHRDRPSRWAFFVHAGP